MVKLARQGERISVHLSTIAGMPAAKTFSKKLVFMRQCFCLATKLILVGSVRTTGKTHEDSRHAWGSDLMTKLSLKAKNLSQ
ncbi:hypothetical protein BZG74_15385 [Salinivibrio sharmensis]|uniref:Uncharacterized protein n=1 Tax=Salinivibrio sharmensis TaxID=390883 RepID=A0ABX3K7G7_9GAMM|nr:hypothetical protein BZG74_15385 [Salinivibrio sharmensis]